MTSPEYGEMAVTESPENDPSTETDKANDSPAAEDAKPPRSFLGLGRLGPFFGKKPADDSPPETEPVIEPPRGRGN
jgi:hypothetical protein